MIAETWNPHRYIEHFGSKERLMSITGLHPRAFHKAYIARKINPDIKAFLDKSANFTTDDRFKTLSKLIENGYGKNDLIAKYGCSLYQLNIELKTRYGTIDAYEIRKQLKEDRFQKVKSDKVNEDVLFAVKTFDTIKGIKIFLRVSERTARRRLEEEFGTSSLLGIKFILEKKGPH